MWGRPVGWVNGTEYCNEKEKGGWASVVIGPGCEFCFIFVTGLLVSIFCLVGVRPLSWYYLDEDPVLLLPSWACLYIIFTVIYTLPPVMDEISSVLLSFHSFWHRCYSSWASSSSLPSCSLSFHLDFFLHFPYVLVKSFTMFLTDTTEILWKVVLSECKKCSFKLILQPRFFKFSNKFCTIFLESGLILFSKKYSTTFLKLCLAFF